MSDVRLTVAVLHVPDDPQRRAWVAEIRRRLAAEGLRDVAVVADHRREGRFATVRQAYLAGAHLGTHHLLLADDMVPVVGFVRQAQRALEARPDHPVSFFSMREPVAVAAKLGKTWAVCPDSTWGGSVCLPRRISDAYLDWERDGGVPPGFKAGVPLAGAKYFDYRLAGFLSRVAREPVWVSVPSLLQHEGAATSTLGFANSRRTAAALYEAGRDGDVDWAGGVDDPARMPGTLPSKVVAELGL